MKDKIVSSIEIDLNLIHAPCVYDFREKILCLAQ